MKTSIATLVATKLVELLKPWLLAQWKEHGPELIEKVKAFIREQFAQWMPALIKSTVVAVAQSAGQLTVNTVDKVTDIIPGDLDDQFLDPFVSRAFDEIEKLVGIKLR
jgi:hypothetical protein